MRTFISTRQFHAIRESYHPATRAAIRAGIGKKKAHLREKIIAALPAAEQDQVRRELANYAAMNAARMDQNFVSVREFALDEASLQRVTEWAVKNLPEFFAPDYVQPPHRAELAALLGHDDQQIITLYLRRVADDRARERERREAAANLALARELLARHDRWLVWYQTCFVDAILGGHVVSRDQMLAMPRTRENPPPRDTPPGAIVPDHWLIAELVAVPVDATGNAIWEHGGRKFDAQPVAWFDALARLEEVAR